ncbi:MAG: L,D-transpeptidase family protein [Actinomycetaceae bacterium]|nr:L,D-transpeptidase family protein [Actinomycetaceae bacterium]MDY5854154.1 L,D-transpeptidase family protein [Arcanobacterium sp.]
MSTKSSTSTKKKIGIPALILAALALLGMGAYIGYFAVGHRALPGTYVGSVKVAGLTQEEIAQRLALANDSKVNISGTGVHTTSATLTDMGFSFDPQAIASETMAANKVWWKYGAALFNKTTVQPELEINHKVASAFAAGLTNGKADAVAPVDPRIEFKGEKFVIKHGSDGKGVSVTSLMEPANELVSTLRNVDFTATITPVAPLLKEADLKEKLDAANNLIAPTITIKGADETFTASPSDKAAWVDANAATPTLNADAVKAWVQSQANNFKVEGVTGVRLVDSDGKLLKTKTDAVAGTDVTNVDEVTATINKNLTEGTPTNATFVISTSELTWTDKKVAAGAENLPYLAAEGEHWIDINLSTNRVRAYEGATLIYDFPMIDGAPGTPTIQGEFAVSAKLTVQTMRGRNADGSTYTTPDVPWVMYFSGDYATHGSSAWRSSWGYDAGEGGSHGCVNMSNEDARTLWEWASMGTPVVSHA